MLVFKTNPVYYFKISFSLKIYIQIQTTNFILLLGQQHISIRSKTNSYKNIEERIIHI